MNLGDLQTTWNALGSTDPLWAVLSHTDKKGRRWDAAEFFATGVREIEALVNDLRALNLGLGRRAALDFGCGVGRLTQPLAQRFDEVVGVDLSAEMVRTAQAHNHAPERCRFVVNTTPDLALFPTGTFDLVVSFLTLQHIPPRYSRSYLREFVRIVRPGGVICVQLPAAPAVLAAAVRVPIWRAKNAVRALLARVGIGRGAQMSMYGLSQTTVVAVLRDAGARLVDVTAADPLTPGWTGYRYVAVKD